MRDVQVGSGHVVRGRGRHLMSRYVIPIDITSNRMG